MRVRSLQTYLTNQGLVNTNPLEDLRGLRVGVDAIYWLRTLPNLKDPLADAIGGLPLSVFGVLDSHLHFLAKQQIGMLFVFQGMQPRSHMLFSSQLHQQMDEAWRLVSEGEYVAAQHRFAQATSRINSDFVYVVSHYLQAKNCEVFQAPYFAASQLSYFSQEEVVDAVFGPPALLLFGIPRVIIGINFAKREFEWIDRDRLLSTWKVSEEQFIDACLLAGTEYCLTFPYLNLSQFHGGSQNFHFGTAIDFIRQAPLVGYMQHFPSEEMRLDHVDGYCVGKSLIKFSLAFHFDGHVRALRRKKPWNRLEKIKSEQIQSKGIKADVKVKNDDDMNSEKNAKDFAEKQIKEEAGPLQVPSDFSKIVDLLSRKLPTVLALGEWWNISHPTVDSVEYRDLLNEIQQYRRRAVGLIAMRLHPSIREKSIKFSRYTCAPPSYGHSNTPASEALPDCRPGMPWSFTVDELHAEMKRQATDKISFRFCLNWHANENAHGRRLLYNGKTKAADGSYFTPEGGVTVFGSALTTTNPEFEEDVLFALELMKCGDLMGDPLLPPPDRPFPENITLLRHSENAPFERQILLLSRVVSLIPMSLANSDLWLAPVDFDLAAFHSVVKTLKRTFRHLAEACLANLLLQDISATAHIPLSALDPKTGGFLSFLLPRNCLGIMMKHFLEFRPNKNDKERLELPGPIFLTPSINNDPDESTYVSHPVLQQNLAKLETELNRFYPCCISHMADLFKGIRFWLEMVEIIELLSQNIEVNVLKVDMDEANHFLLQRICECGLHLHPTFSTEPFSRMRSVIGPYVNAIIEHLDNKKVSSELVASSVCISSIEVIDKVGAGKPQEMTN